MPVDATCDDWSAKKDKATFVKVYGREGASGTQRLVGTPEPRLVYFAPDGKGQQQIWGGAWIKFDQLDLTGGGTIKASIYAEGAPYDAKDHPERAGKLSGNFTATICK